MSPVLTPLPRISNNELQLRKLDKRDKTFKTFIIIILLAVVVIASYSLFAIHHTADINEQNIIEHRETVEESDRAAEEQLRIAALANKARGDIILCIISVSPTERTPVYVKSCYDRVEKAHQIKVERFGDGVY